MAHSSVIARSLSDEAVQTLEMKEDWIASLRSQCGFNIRSSRTSTAAFMAMPH